MKIISWNINGLRAIIKKDFQGFLKKVRPDVLCLQEIKIDAEAIEKEQFDFSKYTVFFNSAKRKGYSGTAILARNGFKTDILTSYKWDDEGRVQVLDLDKFYLINIYFPNSNHELSRLDFKIKFNNRLLREFKKLEKIKPLIICGDYNVAHNEIDLARPKENEGNPGFHPRERAWMNKFLKAGYIDTFREKYPDKIQYSWWSYRAGARTRNVGWRIDYFCVSAKIGKDIKKAFVLDKIIGSDHCPVGIVVE